MEDCKTFGTLPFSILARHAFISQSLLKSLVSKKIISLIKENNKKIQCSIQNEQIRVTGKKRDDLQEVIQLIKDSKIEIPLNYGNFRD